MTINAYINRYPVLIYYVLVFAISWSGFMLVGGTGLFASSSWQTGLGGGRVHNKLV